MKRKHVVEAILPVILTVLVARAYIASAGYITVYPVQTPVTTYTPEYHYTELTVDVTPKYMQIQQGVQVTWTVKITVDVVESNVIDRIEMWIRPHDGWTTTITMANIIDMPAGTSYSGPTSDHDNFYLFYAEKSVGNFTAGDKVTIQFAITSPSTLTPGSYELVKVYHRTTRDGWNGQESTSDYDIQVYFLVGPEFVIPEIPLGTISVIALLSAAVIIRYGKTAILPARPH